MGRLSFGLWCLSRWAFNQPRSCPFCDSSESRLLARKRGLLELRRCARCRLMFRWPKEEEARGQRFYQSAYHEGETTETPALPALEQLLKNGFVGSGNDFTPYISLLRRYRQGGRLLDFGCSWGYGVWQFRAAGYEASGFEISKPRARFGIEHLGVEIIDDPNGLAQLPDASFDIVHAAHALEHLPRPRPVIEAITRLLRPGGLFLIFVPNCGGAAARAEGVNWGPMINEKHPLALDADFFAANLPHFGYALEFASSPYELEPQSDPSNLDGEELMVAAQLPS